MFRWLFGGIIDRYKQRSLNKKVRSMWSGPMVGEEECTLNGLKDSYGKDILHKALLLQHLKTRGGKVPYLGGDVELCLGDIMNLRYEKEEEEKRRDKCRKENKKQLDAYLISMKDRSDKKIQRHIHGSTFVASDSRKKRGRAFSRIEVGRIG